MSSGFRPRWMDCDEPGWNPDSVGIPLPNPNKPATAWLWHCRPNASSIPSATRCTSTRRLRKRQEERQLAGRQNRVRHPAGADYDDGRKLHVYPGFFRRRQLSDHRRAVVGSFADRARIGRRIRRIVLGAYEEGATHQLWRFEQPATDRIISCLRETGWLSICATSSWRMEAPLSPTQETTDGTSSSISTAPAPWIRISPPCRKRLTTRTTTKRFAQTAVARSPSAFSTSSKPSNPRFPSTR